MKSLPTIDRRGWLALWAQKRRRARRAPAAPLLWPVYPTTLNWEWTATNPYRWRILVSWDDGASWNFNSEYWTSGADRDFVPDGGSSLHLVVGVDENGNEITGRSNAVRPDDAPAPETNLLDGIIGYWPLDEASGTRYEAGGSLNDLTEWSFAEAENWGPPGCSTVGSVAGLVGNAASFSFDYASALRVTLNSELWLGDFTLTCWHNYYAMGNYGSQALLCLGGLVHSQIFSTTGDVQFTIFDYNTETHSQIQTPEWGISDGSWAHLAFVREGLALKIYVNGAVAATGTYTGQCSSVPNTFFTDNDLIVGVSPWGYPNQGLIDEVGLWGRALTQGDIEALYNFGSGYDLYV